MALTLKTIEPVKIDDKSCAPKVNAEQRLRLSEVKLDTEEERAEAIKLIASCFPADEKYVAGKLEQMMTFDIQRLQAYLMAGDTGLDMIDRALEKAMEGVNG